MNRNIKLLVFLLLYIGTFDCISQNTVGVTSIDTDEVIDGYTLLYPLNQSSVFLINNCGEVIHEWVDSTIYRPGNSVYLLDNGDLLKTKKPNFPIPGSFSSGGSGAIVERVSWNNDLIWSKEIVGETFRMHHDVEILPNGNVLIIIWQRRSLDELIDAGGDPSVLNIQEIWPDIIQEYDPKLDSIVWVWDSWNQLVQDFDESKPNFGDVSENIGKINLNYVRDGFGLRPDWLHINSVDYNEDLDQILLCTPHFEEIWIIDHSTTTEEAKGDEGGRYGRGGQLLFRWGNPRAYDSGGTGDKKLFFQHDAQWFDHPSLSNSEYYQKIGLFNNRVQNDISSINILEPILNSETEDYELLDGNYIPTDFSLSFESSDDIEFQSSNMSGVQLLSNGNLLTCAAQRGALFEITPEEEVVWSYVLPFKNGFRVSQDTELSIGDNVIFRANKYDADHPAFMGRDLSAKYYLELNPNTAFCDIDLNVIEHNSNYFSLFPIPTQDILTIRSNDIAIESVIVYNSIGQIIRSYNKLNSLNYSFNTTDLAEGLHYIILNNKFIYKTLIIRE